MMGQFNLIIIMKERNRGISAQLNSSHSSVTQPVGQGRNARRVEQIQALHLQFQDLKKKIKDVENKNERIIQNIHKRYDFKKKPQTMECMVEKPPIVYYEHQQDKTQLSAQNQSCNSNQSECQFKIAKPKPKKSSNIKKNINPAHQSLEFRKTEQNIVQRQGSQIGSNKSGFNPPIKQMSSGPQYPYGTASHFRAQNSPSEQYQVNQFSGVHPYQMSMQFPPYPSMAYSQPESFYPNNTFQLQQNLRRQRQKIKVLEKELQQKQNDTVTLKRLQKKYNTLSITYSQLIESSMEEFMEEIIKKKLYQIQKFVRKNENKLRRLHLMIKDKNEESRSVRNISEHQRKRSSSRNKKQYSPVNPNYTSVPRGPRKTVSTQQQLLIQGETSSASKSKQSDQTRSNIKFQQIATQYQEMIKVKNKELESFEMRLKQKERELIEMGAKCAKLELKVAQMEETQKQVRRTTSDRDDNLLANLDFETQKDVQIKQLNKKIAELDDFVKKKQAELKEKDISIEKIAKKAGDFEAKAKKYESEAKKMREQVKKIELLSKDDTQLQIRFKRLQNELQSKEKEYTLTKQRYVKLQSEKIQQECQYMTISNKLKKVELLLTVKEEKIQQLQKIIQSNSGNEVPDLLQKSIFLDKIQHNEIHRLQEEKEKIEEENIKKDEQLYILRRNYDSMNSKLQESNNEIETLKKEIQALQIQHQSTQINLKAMEFEKYSMKNDSRSPLQKLLEENECISENEDNSAVREELQQMRTKYQQCQRQLKIQKHESLEFNTKLIKINSELTYYKQLLSQREGKYEKLRKQFEEGRIQINQLQQMLQEKDNQLQLEKKMNSQRIMELETQWLEFEEEMRSKDQTENNNISDLKSSRNFSEDSFVGYKNTFNSINAQNQHLTEKLKQAQKIIEIQKEMEDKIMNEYRSNVDKIKAQLREKVKYAESLEEELQNLKRKVKVLQKNELRLKQMAERGEKDLLGETNSKIYVLQMQLAELKQLKSKQQAVEQEVFKQIAQKQQENESLVRLINAKERRIEELQDLLELKQMQVTSNISSSQNKSKIKQSLQSNSSLRYSMLSNNHNKDRTIDFDLSEAGQSFYQHNQSMISNVSEVFGRDQFPYEKMQLKRVQQRRLFEKTAAYIKSLKAAIEEKNKKIKLLQKKIESLRNSQLIRQDLYEVKQMMDLEPDDQDIFKDYYSMQNYSSSSQRYKLKQLEHETKLTIEQNNLLINQIESMQDQLLKAEEQQTSLMKLKDLYKEEIKNLIKKNQEQTKAFEEQLRKEKQKVQQNQSVQKMEAIKQLYIKIINVIVIIEHEGPKSKKREEHKKELEEYSKIFCNFLNLDEATRQKILGDIRR